MGITNTTPKQRNSQTVPSRDLNVKIEETDTSPESQLTSACKKDE